MVNEVPTAQGPFRALAIRRNQLIRFQLAMVWVPISKLLMLNGRKFEATPFRTVHP